MQRRRERGNRTAKRKQRGNGEGSIYEHKRDGGKVGYRGAYTVHASEGPKRRYVGGKTREEARLKLTKAVRVHNPPAHRAVLGPR